MGDSRYKRVSRRSPCLICGKPDWCSRAADDSISFCARITAGADRLSRKERWGVYYHNRELLNHPFWKRNEPRNIHEPREEIPIAPLEIRNFIYSTLIRLSPASDYQCLTTGAKGLSSRGLENFDDYGALPGSFADRKDLARQLRLLLNQNYSSFVRENNRGIAHIPGFWLNNSGESCLWLEKDFGEPMLIVPYRNPWGQIQVCQIRSGNKFKPGEKRYLWLSLPSKASAGSGTPIHYANWKSFSADSPSRLPLLVTEGALKADVVANIRPDFLTIANSGIGCAHELIIKITSGKNVYLAFDNDFNENPSVFRQLSKLILSLVGCDETKFFPDNLKILAWDKHHKGIDDALLSGGEIIENSLSDWLFNLSVGNQSIFEQIRLDELKFNTV